MGSYLWMRRVRRLKEIKDAISRGMTWLKAKYADKTKWMINSKKVPLMMIILPSEVDDDG